MNKIITKIMSCVIIMSIICSVIPYDKHECYATNNSTNIEYDDKTTPPHNITNEELKTFINDYFNNKMEEFSVPGAQVTVVRDNKEILTSSYGYADLSTKEKVDSENTTFPAASVSKLFTAVGIMKLYEEGKIDLDKDVNEYISPYKIKNKFNKPVTCRNLLTHSSGLDEESEINTKTEDKLNIKSQEYYFENNTPVVIAEPDTISRYSNQGYNLLGFIIEKVSSLSYEDYIEQNILKPLNMNKTTIRINNDNMAKGYMDSSEERVPFSYQYTSGSSGIISTSSDMGNFMCAILNKGQFNGVRILKPETVEMMEKTQFSNDDHFPGMGFGFIKDNSNGAEIIKHEGALPGYVTTMFMLPKENLGIYISTNKMGPLPFNFEREFINNFYNNENTMFQDLFNERNTNKDFSLYAGHYRAYDGTSKKLIPKIFSINEDTEIIDNKDGTLTLKEYTNEHTNLITRLVEKEENVFVREDNNEYYTFRLNNKGKVEYAFNKVSHTTFEKLNIFEYQNTVYLFMFGPLLLYLINIVTCFILRIKKRKDKEYLRKNHFKHLNVISEILSIIGIFGTIFSCSTVMYFNDTYFTYKVLYAPLIMIIIYVLSSIISLLYYVMSMIRNKFNRKEKVYWLIINIANSLLIVYLYYFNLIGFKLS